MILSVLGIIVAGFLEFLISKFPVANQENLDAFTRNMSGLRTFMAGSSWIFPMNEFLLFLGIIISIELSLFTFRLVKWIVGYISLGTLRD